VESGTSKASCLQDVVCGFHAQEFGFESLRRHLTCNQWNSNQFIPPGHARQHSDLSGSVRRLRIRTGR
jgi:hypothetical protein